MPKYSDSAAVADVSNNPLVSVAKPNMNSAVDIQSNEEDVSYGELSSATQVSIVNIFSMLCDTCSFIKM